MTSHNFAVFCCLKGNHEFWSTLMGRMMTQKQECLEARFILEAAYHMWLECCYWMKKLQALSKAIRSLYMNL